MLDTARIKSNGVKVFVVRKGNKNTRIVEASGAQILVPTNTLDFIDIPEHPHSGLTKVIPATGGIDPGTSAL